MESTLKKKVKFVVIGFFILIIPIGYFVKNAIAIEIHDKAMRKTLEIYGNDSIKIKESIKELDKAIWLYRRNYLFYADKSTLLCKLQRYKEAIAVINEIYDFKPNYVEGYEIQGLIYDKLNQTELANNCYQKAIEIRTQRVSDNSTDEYNNKMEKLGIAFDNWLIYGKERGLKEISVLLKEYPNDEMIKIQETIMLTSDRKTYTNEIIP